MGFSTVIGVLLIALSLLLLAYNLRLLRRYKKTTATIVQIIRDTGEIPGQEGDIPKLQFADLTGKTFTTYADIHSFWRIGQVFNILYDPRNPLVIKIYGLEFWVPPIIFALAGLFFLYFGSNSPY